MTLSTPVGSHAQFGELGRKCISMSVAISLASLYMYYMYKMILQYQNGFPLSARIPIVANSGLRSEMELWFEVRARMNGELRYDVAPHALSISRATYASFTSWGVGEALSEEPLAQWKYFERQRVFQPNICDVQSVRPTSGRPPELPMS